MTTCENYVGIECADQNYNTCIEYNCLECGFNKGCEYCAFRKNVKYCDTTKKVVVNK